MTRRIVDEPVIEGAALYVYEVVAKDISPFEKLDAQALVQARTRSHARYLFAKEHHIPFEHKMSVRRRFDIVVGTGDYQLCANGWEVEMTPELKARGQREFDAAQADEWGKDAYA